MYGTEFAAFVVTTITVVHPPTMLKARLVPDRERPIFGRLVSTWRAPLPTDMPEG